MQTQPYPIFVTTHGMSDGRASQASAALTQSGHSPLRVYGDVDVSVAPIGRPSEAAHHAVASDDLLAKVAPLVGAADQSEGRAIYGTTVSVGYSNGHIAHLSAERGPVAQAAAAVSELLLKVAR